MILIIAEKPSLGRNIASGIGDFQKRNGYLENKDYIITWTFGHLFSLADIEAYCHNPNSNATRWSMDNLPCFPETFIYELKKGNDKKVDDGVLKQFKMANHKGISNY